MTRKTLSLNRITKIFPGVVALDDVSMSFQEGEVHALLGENGAGKSTLIKIVSGALEPDSGTIEFGDGNAYSRLTPHLAKSLGVETIYQEFNLIGCLSAAENIFLGERFGRFVDLKAMERKAQAIFQELGIEIDPKADVDTLPSSKQQFVEIAKAVSRNARILIMDEPTAPLSVAEVDRLFELIGRLKGKGITIVYISHRMEELFAITDRVSVMRDGKYIATRDTRSASRAELINLMVGRELKEQFPVRSVRPGEVALELRALCGNGDVDVSLSVRKGEILGMAGLVGSGRTELARLVYGADRADSGVILVKGIERRVDSPARAIEYGIGLIPEDRKQQGCVLGISIRENISLSSLRRLSRLLVIDGKREKALAAKFYERLRIRSPSIERPVESLSGGNQQKVVIAKTLASNSEVLVFDEPTRGIDVGAKQEIYALMNELASQGHAILMISSEMEELIGMSDRIVVMNEGRLSGELARNEFDQRVIMELASASQTTGAANVVNSQSGQV